MDVSDPPIIHFPSEGLDVWEGYGNGISIFPWFFHDYSPTFQWLFLWFFTWMVMILCWVWKGQLWHYGSFLGEAGIIQGVERADGIINLQTQGSRRLVLCCFNVHPFSFCYRKCWGRWEIEDIIHISSTPGKEGKLIKELSFLLILLLVFQWESYPFIIFCWYCHITNFDLFPLSEQRPKVTLVILGLRP